MYGGLFYFIQGRRSHGGAGAPAPVAQIARGQHGGKRLPFLQELHFKTSMLLTWIYIEVSVFKQFIEI